MLAEAAALLACPNCSGPLEHEDSVLLCARGHSFDIARQGYVSLATGTASKITGDTAEMVAARATFLDAGHFDPIADAVAQAVAEHAQGPARILEVGAGTGHYLCRAVTNVPDSVGIGMDVSKIAARRIARIHPAIAAVVADAWQRLPILDDCLTHALSIFAPRNADEVRRVLAADGVYVVATPTSRHLRELVEPLGMVRVDDDKTRRLGDAMAGRFERVQRVPVDYAMTLDAAAMEAVVAMGPSAHHITPQRRAELIAGLPEELSTTASVVISTYRPRSASE